LKKLIHILTIILIFSACKESESNQEVDFKKTEFNYLFDPTTDYVEMPIDSFENYDKLVYRLEKSICSSKKTVLKFENDSFIYRIKPINFCPENATIFDYFERDVLWITPDSVIVDYELAYPLDSLRIIMERHLINKNKDPKYPRKKTKLSYLKSGFLKIRIDSSKSIKETKRVFQRIVNNFNEINGLNHDSLYLYVELVPNN